MLGWRRRKRSKREGIVRGECRDEGTRGGRENEEDGPRARKRAGSTKTREQEDEEEKEGGGGPDEEGQGGEEECWDGSAQVGLNRRRHKTT